MHRPLTLAVVGTGFLARTRLRCWQRVFGIPVEVVVAARDVDDPAAFARETGAVRGVSIEAALGDPTVELVDLCVPNAAHAELCARAAAAGKHVLCTKPLTAYCGQGLPADISPAAVAATDRAVMLQRAVADGEAMLDACRRASVRLFYGENWLFAPAIVRAAALAAASGGVALELRGWESHSGSHASYARDWQKAGGGALLRLGAHPIGAMLWWKAREGMRRRGAPVRCVAVTAEVADLSAAVGGAACEVARDWSPVENWGCCVLHFDDGSRGVAYGSDNLLGGMQSHLSVFGSDHRFECSLSPMDALRAYAVRDGAFGDEYVMEKVAGQAGWSTPMPDEDWSSGQQGMLQAVAEELRGGKAAGADGALGVEVVRVVYSAYVSAREGRRVEIGG